MDVTNEYLRDLLAYLGLWLESRTHSPAELSDKISEILPFYEWGSKYNDIASVIRNLVRGAKYLRELQRLRRNTGLSSTSSEYN